MQVEGWLFGVYVVKPDDLVTDVAHGHAATPRARDLNQNSLPIGHCQASVLHATAALACAKLVLSNHAEAPSRFHGIFSQVRKEDGCLGLSLDR